jgi:UDP-N-acetylmuramyl pentapeptide phosphotransferase/UDP-N-acetylglucosamine-1-phosphate transferase
MPLGDTSRAAITPLQPASSLLLPAAAAFSVSVAVLILLLRGGVRGMALDHPNERSLHSLPIPRGGGLAILAGVLSGCALSAAPVPWTLVGLAVLLAAVSFADDVRSLRAKWRLVAHLSAAGVVCVLFAESFPSLLWLPVGWLAVAWMTNLYNFMDGADGLAGGMAVCGFGAYGLAAWMGGDVAFASVNIVVAAAAAGFLLFNFPPAKVFMGDVGSIPLGFLAAALGLAGWANGLWAAWFPLAVFAPFILDASVTLVRRALRGERIWQAHRTHYYQRLVLTGWSHRRLATVEYGLMLVTAAVAIVARDRSAALQAVLLLALAAAYLTAALAVDRRWRTQAEG